MEALANQLDSKEESMRNLPMTGMLTTLTSQSAALRHSRRMFDAV